jgi:hypothetical protein
MCIFLYVRRRSGGLYALISCLFLLLTWLYLTFSVDARPYALVVAAISFSLLCYQRASSVLRIMLLGLGLAVGHSLHYYAFLALTPSLIAEAYYFFARGRFGGRLGRISIWLATADFGIACFGSHET